VTDKRTRMLGDIVLASSVGLEIGPLHAPMVQRHEGRVLYVDYASADTLRANFRHPDGAADIVDVDIIWGDRPLRDCVGEPVDYVVASHVIEHVPDLIGWLLELHGVLKPGGIVGLAIPDRRRTFDVRRPISQLGEMMEAYLHRHRQPSVCQVFDAAALSKDSPEAEDWRAGESWLGLPAEVLGRLEPARDMVKALAVKPRYIDAHCWIFTPAAFLDTAEGLHRMGYFAFEIEGFHPTEPGAIEFQVRLRAVAEGDDGKIAASIARGRARLKAVTPPSETAALQQRIVALAAENATLHADMSSIRRSKSWRATASLRAAMQLLRRFR